MRFTPERPPCGAMPSAGSKTASRTGASAAMCSAPICTALFDTGSLTQKLAEYLCQRKGISCEQAAPVSHAQYQEQQFDLLADGIRRALDMNAIYALIEGKR